MSLLNAHRRVTALAELSQRQFGLIRSLLADLGEVYENVEDEEARARIDATIADVHAQVAAMEDALKAALKGLPEGQEDDLTDEQAPPEWP